MASNWFVPRYGIVYPSEDGKQMPGDIYRWAILVLKGLFRLLMKCLKMTCQSHRIILDSDNLVTNDYLHTFKLIGWHDRLWSCVVIDSQFTHHDRLLMSSLSHIDLHFRKHYRKCGLRTNRSSTEMTWTDVIHQIPAATLYSPDTLSLVLKRLRDWVGWGKEESENIMKSLKCTVGLHGVTHTHTHTHPPNCVCVCEHDWLRLSINNTDSCVPQMLIKLVYGLITVVVIELNVGL